MQDETLKPEGVATPLHRGVLRTFVNGFFCQNLGCKDVPDLPIQEVAVLFPLLAGGRFEISVERFPEGLYAPE